MAGTVFQNEDGIMTHTQSQGNENEETAHTVKIPVFHS
jgi:hypothetical protein